MPENITETGKKCTACKTGNVVLHVYEAYDPDTGPMIFGPGSLKQFKSVSNYYCESCGISYRFPPKDVS